MPANNNNSTYLRSFGKWTNVSSQYFLILILIYVYLFLTKILRFLSRVFFFFIRPTLDPVNRRRRRRSVFAVPLKRGDFLYCAIIIVGTFWSIRVFFFFFYRVESERFENFHRWFAFERLKKSSFCVEQIYTRQSNKIQRTSLNNTEL